MKSRFYILGFIILLCSCGNDLSRSKAKSLIIKARAIPYKVTEPVSRTYTVEYSSSGMAVCLEIDPHYFSQNEKMLTAFVNKGLIILHDKENTSGNCLWRGKEIEFTDAGKKYVAQYDEKREMYAVTLFDMAFGEVTGIEMDGDKHHARAEYTLKPDNITPFGESVHVTNDKIRKNAYFTKYDDGWRINQ